MLSRLAPFLFFVCLILVIVPLSWGYMFLLDDTPTPYMDIVSPWQWTDGIGALAVHAGRAIVGTMATQRLLYMLALAIMAWAGWLISRPYGRVTGTFAGVFALVNPFVYVRFLDGQVYVLLGYALLLLAVALRLSPPDRHPPKVSIITGLILGLAVSFLPHAIFFVPLLFILFLFAENTPFMTRLSHTATTFALTIFINIPLLCSAIIPS